MHSPFLSSSTAIVFLATLTPSFADPSAATAPRVDRFGQSIRANYTGKITDEAELRRDLAAERATPARAPAIPLDAWGGLAGSREKFQLEATGFFHTGRIADRDVLVTPGGNVFFQLGVCGLMPLDDYTYVEGRRESYEWLPPRDGVFASAWLHDGSPVVSFYLANWIRKHGRAFDLELWASETIHRLRAWGFNSAGAWSRPTRAGAEASFPFARMLPIPAELPVLPGSHGLWDAFAPDAAAALDRLFAERIAPEKDNPLVIGYFLGNEQLFENIPKIVPTLKADSPAKRRFIEVLRERYASDIAAFERAWAIAEPARDFDELLARSLTVATDRAASDVQAFTELFIEQHYRLLAETFRRHDPHHLLLGSRWQPGTANREALVRIAARHLDVISVNYYTYAFDRSFLDRIHSWSGGKPLLLSEWYFGSTEAGLNGGKAVENQMARGMAYRHYVENAAAIPFIVGHEWFVYLDQPITGRYLPGSPRLYDGEASNTGLVNVVDRPYRELVDAATETNARIYDVMLGRTAPFQFDDPRFTGSQSRRRARTVDAPRAEPDMKIDGVMADWPGRPGEPIGPQRLVVGKMSENFSADFRLSWDEANLYVFVQVQDATPARNRHDGSELWNGDAIELFLGGAALSEDGPPRFDDRHLIVRAAPGTPAAVRRENGSTPDGVVASVVRNVANDGYTVEIAVPWRELQITPAAGRELLFDLAVDESSDGLVRTRQLMWNGTDRNGSERGAWGRLRLIAN